MNVSFAVSVTCLHQQGQREQLRPLTAVHALTKDEAAWYENNLRQTQILWLKAEEEETDLGVKKTPTEQEGEAGEQQQALALSDVEMISYALHTLPDQQGDLAAIRSVIDQDLCSQDKKAERRLTNSSLRRTLLSHPDKFHWSTSACAGKDIFSFANRQPSHSILPTSKLRRTKRWSKSPWS
jgi:hypothetical protein